MNKELSLQDLYEMLMITNTYHKQGFCNQGKVQIEVEHAIEILTRLIAHEVKGVEV